MYNLKPQPVDIYGDFVASVAEVKLWDVVLDDDGDEAIADLKSEDTITVVTAVETETDTWTVTLSDDDSTVVTGLTKTGEVDIASSTEDEVNGPYSWNCVLDDGHFATVLAATGTPIVDSFVYYLPGSPVNFVPAEPTWLSMTAAEYTKWM